jgi:eukaryotic-like serine/threonine-protein kinase
MSAVSSPPKAGTALKATLVGGHSRVPGQDIACLQSTLLGLAPLQPPGTVWGDEADEAVLRALPSKSTTRRTTVLPRRSTIGPAVAESGPRFQSVGPLGEGAMGRVELVRDNDIRRTVAVKRLHAGSSTPDALARFADEIRVVGRLEHPGIVPIYDVDQGEDGQLYLVMKHLQGETMEQVIARLRAADPEYVARFTIEYRVRIFLGVLDAMGYAHARGVLHRDLKPANVMIGPHGEVTVVDWGIAKPIAARSESVVDEPHAAPLLSQAARLLKTQTGALAGTPLYMSPEQAAALNDDLDERSDVYTLCVLFYEWLVLDHPLRDVRSMPQVLATLILNDYTLAQLFEPAQRAGVPMEYIWLARKGLNRERSDRYQSVKELEQAIQAVRDGHIQAQCRITLTKHHTQRFLHWIDRNPQLYNQLVRAATVALVAVVASATVFTLVKLLEMAL